MSKNWQRIRRTHRRNARNGTARSQGAKTLAAKVTWPNVEISTALGLHYRVVDSLRCRGFYTLSDLSKFTESQVREILGRSAGLYMLGEILQQHGRSFAKE